MSVYVFSKECVECGRYVYIDDEICPKCGYDFNLHPRVTPKCPFCEKELHLSDFYITKLDKKGRKERKGFKGELIHYTRMWNCPFCGKILGFSEYA